MATAIYQLARIPILRRCNGYYLRWYYNGWHYWYFLPGRVEFLTAGEDYRTLGMQRLTMGSGQINEEQCNAIRTIKNTREIYIWTDFGWWGCVRIEAGSVIVYDHALHGYEIELSVVVGSRNISQSGFSPAVVLPSVEPDPPCEVDIAVAGQIWMCANWDADFPGSKVYNDDEDNRALFGGLYTWAQVMSAGFVPAGWHVPTYAEWLTLINAVGGLMTAGGELKEAGTTHWDAPNTGAVDTYGYAAWGGGRYGFKLGVGTQFHDLYTTGFFWTQTGFVRMDHDSAEVVDGEGIILPNEYYSLRLIKDGYCPACTALDPSFLTATSFTANWSPVTGATAYFLDVSTDPAFGSFISGFNGLNVGNVTSYDVTGLTPGVTYYYRMRGETVACVGEYSNVMSAVTAVSLLVQSQGTGLGVGALQVQVTAGATFTLDGTARFYSDSAGTLNESTTWTPTPGSSQTRYVRCPSGTANLTLNDNTLLEKIGSVSSSSSGSPGWHHVNTFAASICPRLVCDNWNFPNCVEIAFAYSTVTTFNVAITLLSASLQKTYLFPQGVISGDTADFPATWEIIGINATSNLITGDVANLPAVATEIAIGGGNTLTGDVADLPVNLTFFHITGSNTIGGNLGDLPATLQRISLLGNNVVTGDIAGLPATLTEITIHGNNTVSGDIDDFHDTVTRLNITGQNTITGDLVNIPTGMTYFDVRGYNSIYGGFTGLPVGLTQFYLGGLATVNGDIGDLPTGITHFVIYESGTITGTLASLPISLITFAIESPNTISGAIADLPPTLIGLNVQGSNTISGDIGDLPTTLTSFTLRGNNTVSDYSGKTWTASGYAIYHYPVSGGLSSAEIDQLLIDIDDDCDFLAVSSRYIMLLGTNAPPTATSAAARASLIAKGVTLQTN